MAAHSSILAWRIPWTEEPGGLQSMGLQRVRHDWATKHSTEQCVYVNPSLPIYPSFPPLISIRLSTSVILFLFCNKFICTIFFDFTYKCYHMIFVLLWLMSLSVTISRTIHVAANGVISFFFMVEQYSAVYMCYHIFIRPSVNAHLDCFMSWLLWIVLSEHWGARIKPTLYFLLILFSINFKPTLKFWRLTWIILGTI